MIKVNQVFTIEKSGKKTRWKVIKHPYFDDGYALISDHELIAYNFHDSDCKHIVNGSKDFENLEKTAYFHS